MDRLRATIRGLQPHIPDADQLAKYGGQHISDEALYQKGMLVQAYGNGSEVQGWSLVNRLYREAFEMGYRFVSDRNKPPFVADNAHELSDFVEIAGRGLGSDFKFDGKKRVQALYTLGILEGAIVASK